MSGTNPPRAVIVTRETEYELLLARHATRNQAAFVLRQRNQSLDDVLARHERQQTVLAEVRAGIPRDWRIARVRRAELDRFIFAPEDIVLAVGQDGLVANAAKYLTGQPVLGINPEPERNPGILVPHSAASALRLLQPAAARRVPIEHRTMLRAELEDGQHLLALNEVFVGHFSHQSARYDIAFATKTESQSSSGVIVASGTGATGWALSIVTATKTELKLAPTDRAAVFLVREPWPSKATGASISSGRIEEGARFRLTSRMNEGGVIFGDGIETDRLVFDWGRQVVVSVAKETLSMVPAEAPHPVRRSGANVTVRKAPPPRRHNRATV
jgi:hypothetical protein